MFKPVAQANFFKRGGGGIARNLAGRHVCGFQRGCDIFQRGHVWQKVKGLKDNPDLAAPNKGQLIFIETYKFCAQKLDGAATGGFQAGGDRQEARLARARSAGDGYNLASPDLAIDPFEDMDRAVSSGEGQGYIVKREDNLVLGHTLHIILKGAVAIGAMA